MDICKQVGLNVRDQRLDLGWSQEDLAFESDLHRTYISGIERGIRNPTVSIVERLGKALGVSAAALLAERKR